MSVRARWNMNNNPFEPEETPEQQSRRIDEMIRKNADAAAHFINAECAVVHRANIKWWHDIVTGEPLKRNVGELIALVHSELSEALEGDRKNLMDDKLPHRKMFEVELADAIIRIFDIAAGFDLDLGGAYVEKMAYNRTRADHQHANRIKDGGKKY